MKSNPAERVEEAARELGVLSELIVVRQTYDRDGLENAFVRLKEAADQRARALALQYHPDRPGGDLERMQRINAARDIIRAVTLQTVPMTHPVERPIRREAPRDMGYAPNMPPVRTRIPFRQMAHPDSDGRPDVRGGFEFTWDPLDYDGVPEW